MPQPDLLLRLDLPAWIVLSYVFVIGAVIGSFLNVCIYRLPTKERLRDQLRALSDRPSQCPRCRTNIRWTDNIPILGWLKLRGRCRACKMRISPRYPLIELLNGCLWMLVCWMEVPLGVPASVVDSCLYTDLGPQNYPGLGPLSPEWFVILRFLYHMVLIEALLVASFIDFDLRIIPDGSTLPAMGVGILASCLVARLHIVPVWFQSGNLEMSFAAVTPEWVHPLLQGPAVPEWILEYPHLHGLLVSLCGMAVAGGMIWGVRLCGFWLLKQEAMGFGDVILMGLIGAFLGWQPSVIAFFVAPVCAMAVIAARFMIDLVKRALGRPALSDGMIPYGPYLSLGALLTIVAWKPLFAQTRHVFELGMLLLPIVGGMTVLFCGSLWLVASVKRLLGWRIGPEERSLWRAADQNWYFQGENVDRHTGRWRTRDWDGCASGRGLIHVERWRNGPSHNSGPGRRRTL